VGVSRAGAAAALGLALGFVAAFGLTLAGCACSKIRQSVFIPDADPDTQVLIETCRAHLPTPGETCELPEGKTYLPVDCGCLPLCRRVLELIDQFSGTERLEECHVGFALDGGTGATVSVTYRPSMCE
jgi:hypothetical protein